MSGNHVGPDQMPDSATSDLSSHCLQQACPTQYLQYILYLLTYFLVNGNLAEVNSKSAKQNL